MKWAIFVVLICMILSGIVVIREGLIGERIITIVLALLTFYFIIALISLLPAIIPILIYKVRKLIMKDKIKFKTVVVIYLITLSLCYCIFAPSFVKRASNKAIPIEKINK